MAPFSRVLAVVLIPTIALILAIPSCGGGGSGGGGGLDGGAGSDGGGGTGGSDGSASCASGCPSGEICHQGSCVPECDGKPCCTSDCSGRECGPDPVCGYSCGSCEAGACTVTGQCECAASCAAVGATCGQVSDGCGKMLDCGTCFSNMTCGDNVCSVPGCSGEWSLEAIAPNAKLNFGGGLFVDAAGTVHAVFSSGTHYAKKPAGGSWTLTQTTFGGWNAALAVEASGALHVSYFDTGSQNISVSSRAPGASNWTTAIVDAAGPDQYQDTTSIAADAQGGLHLRYLSQGSLTYAHRAPGASSWTTEIAATPAVAAGSTAHGSNTLAVDAQGGVHSVYFESFSGVSYAYRAPGGGWSKQTLDSDGSMTAPAWLAIDAQGGVHAVYLAAVSRQLRHAYKAAGGSFAKRTLVTKLEQIFDPSLAVSEFGIVHIGYRHQDQLYYLQAPPTGTSLDFYNVLDGGTNVGEYARFALDKTGGVHAVYESGTEVKYGYRCPGPCPAKSCAELNANCGSVYDGCKITQCGTCSDPTLCGAGATPNQCCVPTTCAAAGKDCGALSDGCGKQLDCGGCALQQSCGSVSPNECGACEAGKWTADTVSSLGNVGQTSAVAVDAQGKPHILFSDQTNTDLVYAGYVTGAGWQTSLVDGITGAAYAPLGISLVLDAQGGLHAAYSVFYSATTIRYAYRAPGGTSWAMTEVASGMQGNITRPVLRRDAQGGLHLSYYDGSQNAVIYASRAASGGSWLKTTIASGGANLIPGAMGEEVSLAVDGSGGVHISYSQTQGSMTLMYAHRPPAGTFSTTPIVAGSILAATSIAVDTSGGVHVAYSDPNELRYAYKPGAGSWSNVLVTYADYVESSILLDTQGGVHIVYSGGDSTIYDLHHAEKPALGGWTTSPIDTQGNAGKGNAAALDASGGIRVSCNDFSAQDVKYAYRCPD